LNRILLDANYVAVLKVLEYLIDFWKHWMSQVVQAFGGTYFVHLNSKSWLAVFFANPCFFWDRDIEANRESLLWAQPV
jgi:hypothetical protein